MSSPNNQDPPDETFAFDLAGSYSNSQSSIEQGRSLGRFEIKRQLGIGGMGAVYLAFDPDLERQVAIKVLNDTVRDDPPALARFRAEAQAAGTLNHPNVVAVYEIGEDQNSPYIVMEYVTGGSVVDLLGTQAPLDLADATRIICDATRGIAAAHAKGLIHRDIKPANLMVAADRTIKVGDFGLARARERKTDANMTQEGQILGTPYYMSPEQCQGSEVDGRSDLYALGATYFMLLTGSSPYQNAGSTMDILAAHLNQVPPDPRLLNQGIPAPCVRIIHRLLAKRPDDRYLSADILLGDLNAVLKIVEDPNTAKEVRYRGSVHIPRETFDLPSEVEGTMSRKVDPGGTVAGQLTNADNEQTADMIRPRSWFGGRSKSRKPSADPPSQQSSDRDAPASERAAETSAKQKAARSGRRKTLAARGHRKEVYSGQHGRFVFWWPEKVSQDEIAEVQRWLEMMGSKVQRVADMNAAPSQAGGDTDQKPSDSA